MLSQQLAEVEKNTMKNTEIDVLCGETVAPGLYKHFKGGTYKVLQIAKHSETEELMVVYQSMQDGEAWVRPLSMWNQTITWQDGNPITRFTKHQD